MTSITVRHASPDDLDTLVPLFDQYRQSHRKASDPQGARAFLRARFEHGDAVLFLAWSGDQAAGFTQLYPIHSSVSMARAYILNDLFVHPEWRRKGVAHRLMEAAAAHARSAGAVRIQLCTEAGNAPAVQLYDASGWQRDTELLHFHQYLDVPQHREGRAPG